MTAHRLRHVLVGLLAAVVVFVVGSGSAEARAGTGVTLADDPTGALAGFESHGYPEALAPPAIDPPMALTGEPTAAEAVVIEEQWRRFATSFGRYADCMGPIEVRVVARAEDWYSSRNVGPIAAFYRFPPEAIVFVEHGKVRADVLLHEFAHHLDISCGLGVGPVGETFRFALGLSADRGWTTGTSWRNVPAEMFAEAVVAFFDEKVSITLDPGAVDVIDLISAADEARRPVGRSLFGALASGPPLLHAGADGPNVGPVGDVGAG